LWKSLRLLIGHYCGLDLLNRNEFREINPRVAGSAIGRLLSVAAGFLHFDLANLMDTMTIIPALNLPEAKAAVLRQRNKSCWSLDEELCWFRIT
jgi:hypothetical protein